MGFFDRLLRKTPPSLPTDNQIVQQSLYPLGGTNWAAGINWVYPNVPAHEQRSALMNCWTGNQLPGATNFIPNVPLSVGIHNIPTSYANTLHNQQFNQGFNIQTGTVIQNAQLRTSIMQAWLNRSGIQDGGL